MCGVAACLVAAACLEPNPNAEEAGDTGGSSDSAATDPTTDTTDSGGPSCDPCDFLFESVEFDAINSETVSIPKPDLPHTAPFATVTNYAPGNNADSLGYALTWTDVGDAYELDISLSGASGNSRVSGVALVLGFSEVLGAPEVQEIEVAADTCEPVSIDGLGDRVYIDAVERYEPGGATVLSYARSVDAGSLEYCVTESDAAEASLTYKLVTFALPEEAVALEIPELELDSDVQQSADYPELGAASQIVHLIGARTFDEGVAPSLGYDFACSAQAPYGCSFELLRFNAGARAVAGGSIIAIQ